MCSGNKVCSCQSLADNNPQLMLEWDYEAKPEKLACKPEEGLLEMPGVRHKWEAQARAPRH